GARAAASGEARRRNLRAPTRLDAVFGIAIERIVVAVAVHMMADRIRRGDRPPRQQPRAAAHGRGRITDAAAHQRHTVVGDLVSHQIRVFGHWRSSYLFSIILFAAPRENVRLPFAPLSIFCLRRFSRGPEVNSEGPVSAKHTTMTKLNRQWLIAKR